MAANPAANPPVLITGVNVVAGNGLVAQQNFERGALILQENPLLVYNTEKSSPQGTTKASYLLLQNERDGTTNSLSTAVERLIPPNQAIFDNPFTLRPQAKKPRQRISDRIAYNAFDFQTAGTFHLSVYATLSACSHFYVPNATVHINIRSKKSTRKILTGQARLVASKATRRFA
jgi:hypothetical protein